MRSIGGISAGACAAAIVLALTAAGCGSSDDSSGDDSITKAEFVTQANAICAESNKSINAAEKDAFSGGQPTQADVENFVNDTVIPEVESQITDIRALEVPDGEEDQINAILDAAESGLEEAKSDPAAMAGNQTDPFAEANKLAGEYGMTECAG